MSSARSPKPVKRVERIKLYGHLQVGGQAENTIRPEARELDRFARFYMDFDGHPNRAEWYPSVTREFIKTLQCDKRLGDASVQRIYSTVRCE